MPAAIVLNKKGTKNIVLNCLKSQASSLMPTAIVLNKKETKNIVLNCLKKGPFLYFFWNTRT